MQEHFRELRGTHIPHTPTSSRALVRGVGIAGIDLGATQARV